MTGKVTNCIPDEVRLNLTCLQSPVQIVECRTSPATKGACAGLPTLR